MTLTNGTRSSTTAFKHQLCNGRRRQRGDLAVNDHVNLGCLVRNGSAWLPATFAAVEQAPGREPMHVRCRRRTLQAPRAALSSSYLLPPVLKWYFAGLCAKFDVPRCILLLRFA